MKDNSGMGYAGFSGPGYSRNNSGKIQVNKHSGTMNDGALINKGRGPTGGGTAMPTCGKDMFTGKAQVLQAVSDGQTTAMPKVGRESFNFGRGPTKGNQR
jgi:hypothetical protein